MGDSHYCRKCMKHFQSTHPDPQMVVAICPECGSKMMLNWKPLEQVKRELGLSKSEIGDRKVTYHPL